MTQNKDEATKELLRRFKEYHCEDSLAELFAKYKPLVIRAITSFHFRTLDRDDLLQEAYIICCTTALSYNQTTTKATYGCYFKASLYNRLTTLKREETANKRMGNVLAVPLDSICGDDDSFISENTFSELEAKIALEQVMAKMPRQINVFGK